MAIMVECSSLPVRANEIFDDSTQPILEDHVRNELFRSHWPFLRGHQRYKLLATCYKDLEQCKFVSEYAQHWAKMSVSVLSLSENKPSFWIEIEKLFGNKKNNAIQNLKWEKRVLFGILWFNSLKTYFAWIYRYRT